MKTLITALTFVVGLSVAAMAHKDEKVVTKEKTVEEVTSNGDVETKHSITEQTVSDAKSDPSENHVEVKEEITVEKKHD